jgi:hypothetical protein
MTGYQYGLVWHWDPNGYDMECPGHPAGPFMGATVYCDGSCLPEPEPILRVIVCIPLSMLEPNRYGCNHLPNWDSYFDRRGPR